MSASGRGVVAAVAEELARRGEQVDRVFASPLVRAQETAEIVRRVLRVSSLLETRQELAPSEDGLGLARELARGEGAALVVSHAPDVSDLVMGLTGDHASGFSAGMVVRVDIDGPAAVRRFSIDPAKLQS